MGIGVKTEGLYESSKELGECYREIGKVKSNLKRCKIPPDEYNSNTGLILSMIKGIINYLDLIQEMLVNNGHNISKKAYNFEIAEQSNKESVASLEATIQVINANYGGTTTNTNQAQTGSGTTINPDNEELSPRPPLDVELEDQEQTDNIGDAISVDVEAVIALIFGENVEIPDNVKQTVATAIGHINTTKILDGLDEEYANKIRAEIVQDYLDGKLKL